MRNQVAQLALAVTVAGAFFVLSILYGRRVGDGLAQLEIDELEAIPVLDED